MKQRAEVPSDLPLQEEHMVSDGARYHLFHAHPNLLTRATTLLPRAESPCLSLLSDAHLTKNLEMAAMDSGSTLSPLVQVFGRASIFRQRLCQVARAAAAMFSDEHARRVPLRRSGQGRRLFSEVDLRGYFRYGRRPFHLSRASLVQAPRWHPTNAVQPA